MRALRIVLVGIVAALLHGCPTTGEPNMRGQDTATDFAYPYNPRW